MRRIWWAAEVALVLASVGFAIHGSSLAEWRPVALVLLLGAIYLAGDRLSSIVGDGILTPGHSAMVLTMCLLGPAPAVLFTAVAATAKSALRRLPPSHWLANLASLTGYAFVGSMLARLILGNVHASGAHANTAAFGLTVFVVSLVTISFNFLIVALDVYLEEERSIGRQFRESFLPLIPGHLTSAVLAAILAAAYTGLGLLVLACGVLVLAVFHYLIGALLRSEDRAEKLEARTIHLANMQIGVLSMLMDALSLRDAETSRHATAVARYAKAMAVELGCTDEEQEVIHTAALLHDIGKFTWSDRILRAKELSEADWAIIRRHPQDGAALVGKLDGYGPVADAILYHHERVDGGGYPAGLIAGEIPLASRIVAICSTYDTMVARDTHGPRMSPLDATAELRRIAGGQLDGELVETFVGLIEREGSQLVEDGPGAYEQELAFASRVRRMAAPSS
jgi:putative nucleotidyltransferase with HDIG domain